MQTYRMNNKELGETRRNMRSKKAKTITYDTDWIPLNATTSNTGYRDVLYDVRYSTILHPFDIEWKWV